VRPEYRSNPGLLHQLAIAARIALRALRRRSSSSRPAGVDFGEFRRQLEPWVDSLPRGAVRATAFIDMPATQPPWADSGIDLEAGESVTMFAQGRVYLSRALDVWTPPWFQVWYRIGERGTIFRGTRDLQSFTAAASGRLWLANYFPGEWSDAHGGLATPESEYAKVSGGTSVLVIRWARGVDATTILRSSVVAGPVPATLAREAGRLADPVVAPPDRWEYLWFLGPAEIYRPSLARDGRRSIDCRTHGDTGILVHDARLPLRPATTLRWSWRVDELPTDLPEDTLPSHEYLSIAVEFDDGQDITYFWSSSLPVGTGFGCPLPNWKDRETHVVVRSGAAGLGQWFDEERDIHSDYAKYVGGPAREVARVWLIANSLLTRGRGRCEYAGIEISAGEAKIEVL
jgi:hypothetical protein